MGQYRTDGGQAVEITDWDTITTELERFCEGGELHVESDTASCEIDNATFTVYANGRIKGKMPLHEFDGEVETLVFDHAAGTITAESEVETYTFEKP
jgi:hypothetical protein